MIKEDAIMPWKWILARILEEKHQGKDGIVRAVMVHTTKENFKRPMKLVPISEE